MPVLLTSKGFVDRFGDQIKAVAERAGKTLSFVTLPEQRGERLPPADRERVDCIFLDRDMRFNDAILANYLDTVLQLPKLKWVTFSSSGVGQQSFIAELGAKGVIITSSTGSNAMPVAQTGFAGLMMLARRLDHFTRAQQRREWAPLRGQAAPDDILGQTLLLIGVGAVGTLFAGYARALGLKVVGVRRSPQKPGEPVDEMHPPSKLPELLPRADWIVIACPLTQQTRNLLDADSFERVKKGARLINIGRGEVVDEAAMIEALRNGTLGGAMLDTYHEEPLPLDSLLWDLPNVVLTPHSSSASTGNERRCAEMFIDNFGRWLRGEPMLNVQDVETLKVTA
jgi:phosphoglycerate dehydrogenase-like enzyme